MISNWGRGGRTFPNFLLTNFLMGRMKCKQRGSLKVPNFPDVIYEWSHILNLVPMDSFFEIMNNLVFGACARSWCNSFNHYVGMRRYETVLANMCCNTSRSSSCSIAANRVEHVRVCDKIGSLQFCCVFFWTSHCQH